MHTVNPRIKTQGKTEMSEFFEAYLIFIMSHVHSYKKLLYVGNFLVN